RAGADDHYAGFHHLAFDRFGHHKPRVREQGWSRCDITNIAMANRHLNRGEILAALDWYVAAGGDIAVGEAAVDSFAESSIAAPPPRGRRGPRPRAWPGGTRRADRERRGGRPHAGGERPIA